MFVADLPFLCHKDGNSANFKWEPTTISYVGFHSAWQMGTSRAASLQNSHQNGGPGFLIFVADPRTVRLCTTRIPGVTTPL
jgi:hypothetical protein